MIEQRHRSLTDLVDSVAVLLCGLSADGRIVIANQRCAEISRIERDQLIGTDWRAVFATKERHEHLVSMWTAIGPGRPSAPFEALCRNGRRLRWQFSHWETGAEDARLCAVGTDVTAERDQQAHSRSAQRISALANLGAGLAHELRNPLNSASLQLALLERKVAKATPLQVQLASHISAATDEIHRVAEILDDFLAFARPQQLEIARIDLRDVIEHATVRLRRRASDANVELVLVPGDSLVVELDEERVEGAIGNLVANAIDAAAGGATPEVSVSWHEAGNAAVIEVRDRGPGLPFADAPVFDPFFTTKADGTGLGLAIVERVATDHGGDIEVERQDGTTVFRLRIPIMRGEIES